MTIPGQIKEFDQGRAKVTIQDKDRLVKIELIENPKVGDWVLVNADLAVQKVDEQEAKEILGLFSI